MIQLHAESVGSAVERGLRCYILVSSCRARAQMQYYTILVSSCRGGFSCRECGSSCQGDSAWQGQGLGQAFRRRGNVQVTKHKLLQFNRIIILQTISCGQECLGGERVDICTWGMRIHVSINSPALALWEIVATTDSPPHPTIMIASAVLEV